jgi:hypothetical protein
MCWEPFRTDEGRSWKQYLLQERRKFLPVQFLRASRAPRLVLLPVFFVIPIGNDVLILVPRNIVTVAAIPSPQLRPTQRAVPVLYFLAE